MTNSKKTAKQISLIPLPLSRLNHSELEKLVKNYIADYDSKNLSSESDSTPHLLVTKLRNLHAQYFTAITAPKVEKNTLSIKEADKFRINDFKALQQALKSKSYSRLAQDIEAYTTMANCLKKYKDFSRHSFEEKSSLLEKLFEEVKQEHLKSSLKTLGLSPLIDTLKNSQANFQTAYDKRLRNQLNHQNYDLTSLNKELVSLYTNLSDYCDVMYRIYQTDYYRDHIQTLNNSRKTTKESLNRQVKHDKTATKTSDNQDKSNKQELIQPA